MALTLTQARNVLTKPELELFDQSRAQNIKALNGKQLASKIERTRKLADKSRDLYRRQSASSKKSTGSVDANERTQRKADAMHETLERFEARVAMVQKQDERASAAAERKSPATQSSAKKVTLKKAAAKKVAARNAPAKKAPAKAAAAKKPVAGKVSAKKVVATPVAKEPAAKKVAAKKAPGKQGASVPGKRSTTVRKAVRKALQAQQTEDPGHIGQAGMHSPMKSTKAKNASGYVPEGVAPTDMVARAGRQNPIKDRGGNARIDGHTRVQVRRDQQRRDNR